MERIDLEGENIVLLKCGHTFHSKCILGSLTRGYINTDSYSYKPFCPMCNAGRIEESDFGFELVSRIRLKDFGKIIYPNQNKKAHSYNNYEYIPFNRK